MVGDAYVRDRRHNYRGALRALVASEPIPPSNPLPLTHVTDSINLQAILDADCLSPQFCPVFGDMRVYAFYARPAYRGHKEGPMQNLPHAPVGFIIDASVATDSPPEEVFPFDTGALKHDRLKGHIHGSLSPFDFALEPELNSARQLATLFFGSEKEYFHARNARPVSKPSPHDADVLCYETLVAKGATLGVDERRTSVEFQFKVPLPIRGKALAIILPEDFVHHAPTIKAIRARKVTPLPYPFVPDHSIRDMVGAFYTLTASFYESRKHKRRWSW